MPLMPARLSAIKIARAEKLSVWHRAMFVVSVAAVLGFFCAAAANGRELRIEKFDSEIVILPNGTINVTETIHANFIGGPWHGLYRSIPVEYVTPQGMNYTLFLDVKRVTDGSGHRLKFESSRGR